MTCPKISVTLYPQAIPAFDPEESLARKLVGSLAGWGMNLFMSRPLNKNRHQFGLPPMGSEGITSKLLDLILISPHIIEKNSHWEKGIENFNLPGKINGHIIAFLLQEVDMVWQDSQVGYKKGTKYGR